MTDFLLGLLPGAVARVAELTLLALATALVLVLLARRFSARRTLTVRSWGEPASQTSSDGKALANHLRGHLERIWRAHANQGGLTSSGERASLGNPRRESEDLGSKAVSLLAGNSPVGFLVGLSSRIWPALELEGETVVGEDRKLLCCARLRKGKKFYHAWQRPVPEAKDSSEALAEELAYRIVLDTARIGVLDASQSAGTSNWQAFRALTRAMEIWNRPDFDLDDPEMVEAVAGTLSEAIEADPDYALAWLNRGVLRLLTFRDADTNRQAREDFLQAEALAREKADAEAQTRPVVSRRVEGMAALGLSRTLSQDRHRFGRPDEETVAPARSAAERAVTLLGRSPEALYALAFAWHCTETLGDIRVGREIYEEIIALEPRKHPAVHNNLGYILMVGGEHLRALGQEEEAERWWGEAEGEMRITLRISDTKRRTTPFTHANLGNLYRLRRSFAKAEGEYLEALTPDPETSTYTNGLNELACLYAEMGREEDAARYHELALRSAGDPDHEEKLRQAMSRASGS